MSIDVFAKSVVPLLKALGELYVRGQAIDPEPLFAERTVRQFNIGQPVFLANPCGRSARLKVEIMVDEPPQPQEAHNEPWPDCLGAVLSVLSDQTALPVENIGPDDRFLDELHLNSLAVSRIVSAAARMVGTSPPQMPTSFANASPRMLANALEELRNHGPLSSEIDRICSVRPWVDSFEMRWIDLANTPAEDSSIEWSTIDLREDADFGALPASTTGWCLRLKAPFSRRVAEALIAVSAEAAKRGVQHLAIVHYHAPISAFARSLALENAFQSVRVLGEIPPARDDAMIVSTLSKTTGKYTEFARSPDGSLKVPVFVLSQPCSNEVATGDPSDVVLAIGGARGIAAECVLQLGKRASGLILVGRSPVDTDEVQETLARAERAGIRCSYVSADASKLNDLTSGLDPAAGLIGKPTVLVYAAGLNEPMSISKVDAAAALRCLQPKMDAFSNAIAAAGPLLRRVITFGSLIGRIGLEGEAHYALANAAMTDAALAWTRAAPGRSALALEWSVWGGIGMGERLGTIERLASLGVDPISVDDAVAIFDHLVNSDASGAIAVTSRFGNPPDLFIGQVSLPCLRFVDRLLLHYPGKEIVFETDLSRGRDNYIDDHIIDGQRVLPGVIALEALAQVASCLCPLRIAAVSDVSFERAIQIGEAESVTIRIAAVKTGNKVEAALFVADDSFRAPAVRADFRFEATCKPGFGHSSPALLTGQEFDASALYGTLIFSSGRFKRIERFLYINSREVSAVLKPREETRWFGSFDSGDLLLWDPGAADACLHALQAAVPNRRVIPISVASVAFFSGGQPVSLHAIERSASPGTYTFDIDVRDAQGQIVQLWLAATFRDLNELNFADTIARVPHLAVPYLERSIREAFGDESIRIALVKGGAAINEQSRKEMALAQLGLDGKIDRRADGRPLLPDGAGSMTIAHHNGTTLAVSAQLRIGCDIETAMANDG
ncbi:MAG: SDR family NAD(P)-dependent oxidoreductase, partial [Burkholderiales bacterium]